jgi:Glycosyl transferase family 64 domain
MLPFANNNGLGNHKQYGYMRYVLILCCDERYVHRPHARQYVYVFTSKSTTEKANRYSMALTRYCFLHKDYLNIYTDELPTSILDNIAKNFNGEDIAMSFLISSLTDGKPPLLADTWAMKSMVKLYVETKISGGHDHKHLRDLCVDAIAQMLGLKEEGLSRRLQSAKLYHQHDSFFDCGDTVAEKIERSPKSDRQVKFEKMLGGWHRKSKAGMQQEVRRLMSGAASKAYRQGLIEKSDPWEKRFRRKK